MSYEWWGLWIDRQGSPLHRMIEMSGDTHFGVIGVDK